MGLIKSSLSIILNLYKKGKITEDEATQLIEDIRRPFTYYYPYYPSTVTYNTDEPKWTTTCEGTGTAQSTITETNIY